MDVSELRAKIRDIEDFPTEGILFKDITTLLKDPKAFRCVLDELATGYIQSGVEIVVGVESRGFIFGGALAHELGAGFVPVRKLGEAARPRPSRWSTSSVRTGRRSPCTRTRSARGSGC